METPREPIPETVNYSRLHPMTMVHRLLIAIPGFFLIALPALRSGDRESWVMLAITIAIGAIGLPIVILQYQRFRYRITPKELIIHSGVIKRQHRNIPIERIQNVEIIRRLIPRLFGTARVNVVTAGSTTTEGVLEFVSVREANRIREVIREYQAQATASAMLSETRIGVSPEETILENVIGQDPTASTTVGPQSLYRMSFSRVLLSGIFRFSLFYIAIIFSTLQLFEPDPEQLVDWIEGGYFEQYVATLLQSPIFAAIVLIITASAISWISGILVNINRYYGFKLEMDGQRIHKRSGLLTVAEGTIPLQKIQALIRKTNPVMRHFDWWSLGVQTMGHDVNEQRHKLAVPFGKSLDTTRVASLLYPIKLPDRYEHVSRYTIRRMITRLTVLLFLIVGPVFFVWPPIIWGLALLPLIVLFSFQRYKYHGFSFDGEVFGIRRGVIRHVEWTTSIDKSHVFYLHQSIFQRRYGIKTLYVDTAGASAVSSPSVVDLPGDVADKLLIDLYASFQKYYLDSSTIGIRTDRQD